MTKKDHQFHRYPICTQQYCRTFYTLQQLIETLMNIEHAVGFLLTNIHLAKLTETGPKIYTVQNLWVFSVAT